MLSEKLEFSHAHLNCSKELEFSFSFNHYFILYYNVMYSISIYIGDTIRQDIGNY